MDRRTIKAAASGKRKKESRSQNVARSKNVKGSEINSHHLRALSDVSAASIVAGYAVLPPACGIPQHAVASRVPVMSQMTSDCGI